MCDADLRITNVDASFPGRTHDSYIWNQSTVLPILQELHRRNETHYVLGNKFFKLLYLSAQKVM